MGILTQRALWASSCRFLNDSEEFSYASPKVSKVLAAQVGGRRWLEQEVIRHALTLHEVGSKVFVCSLSEHGDTLSQWRAYGRAGDAYSIALDAPKLSDHLKSTRVQFAPCIYEDRRQSETIEAVVEAILVRVRDTGLKKEDLGLRSAEVHEAAAEAALGFVSLCSLLKHPSFAEEREWRLVSLDGPHIRFREGRLHFVPYVAHELPPLLHEVVQDVTLAPVRSSHWMKRR